MAWFHPMGNVHMVHHRPTLFCLDLQYRLCHSVNTIVLINDSHITMYAFPIEASIFLGQQLKLPSESFYVTCRSQLELDYILRSKKKSHGLSSTSPLKFHLLR